MLWDGTSTHTILDPETECTKVIQGLNNYQLTYLSLSMYLEDRLEPTTDGGRLDEKRLRRDYMTVSPTLNTRTYVRVYDAT